MLPRHAAPQSLSLCPAIICTAPGLCRVYFLAVLHAILLILLFCSIPIFFERYTIDLACERPSSMATPRAPSESGPLDLNKVTSSHSIR